MLKVRFEWTIPNLLSLLRLLLVPVFAVLYLKSDTNPVLLYWAIAVLVISGLSDALDGYIARRFNQMSEFGKLLDPVADKLTQVVVLVCVTIRFSELLPLLVICFVKELLQIIGGLLLFKNSTKIEGSRWYGKLATFVFYGVLAVFLFFEPAPWLSAILIALVAVLMLFAFFNYLHLFIKMRHEDAVSAVNESVDN